MNRSATAPTKVPSQVVRTLYRSLLKEVRTLDARPILKVLFPLPQTLQECAALDSPLYTPNGPKYADVVRRSFRRVDHPPVSVGFEALNRIKTHNASVTPQLPEVTKDHAAMMYALNHAKPTSAFRATPVAPLRSVTLLEGSAVSPTVKADATAILKTPSAVELKVGMCLIAHPLSSAHVDRRVLMITDVNPHVTTAVVLDMTYTATLSHGNPMFPEVFWGHTVSNGGYCHVEYTMPPTANVVILHTLDATRTDAPKDSPWSSWVGGRGTSNEKERESNDIKRKHDLLCTPLIQGEILADGTKEPTLYCSKAEALPYLASLCPGKPSSALRVYWGAMKWPTTQIKSEVLHGHWMPVQVSSSFFRAYPFFAPPSTGELRFASAEELAANREARVKHSGADVVVPQTLPPNHPLCYRESLWDQMLFALGGEYTELVGIMNPFSNPKNTFARVPSVDMLAPPDMDLVLSDDD